MTSMEKGSQVKIAEQNCNEFSLFSNDIFSATYAAGTRPSCSAYIENEDENNFWLNIDKLPNDAARNVLKSSEGI